MITPQNQITTSLIHKITGSPITAGTIATPQNIAKGEVVVTDGGLKVLDATSVLTAETILIVQGAGVDKPLIKSGSLKANNLLGYKGIKHAPAVQKLSVLGYNGTSGAIDVIDDNTYLLRYIPRTNGAGDRSQPLQRYAQFTSKTGDTQLVIVESLLRTMLKQFSNDPQVLAAFYRLSAGTRTAAGTAGNIIFTKGSNIAVASEANAHSNVVVGDYLSTGVAATNGVYKVIAKNGQNLVLDVDSVVTTTALAATGNLRVLAASAANSAAGLACLSLEMPFDTRFFRDYRIARFELTGSNFGSTPFTDVTRGFDGLGVWQQAAWAEYISMGNEGQFELGIPPYNRDSTVTSADSFSILTLHSQEVSDSMVGSGKLNNLVEIYLSTPTNAKQARIVAVLDAFAGIKGFPAQTSVFA